MVIWVLPSFGSEEHPEAEKTVPISIAATSAVAITLFFIPHLFSFHTLTDEARPSRRDINCGIPFGDASSICMKNLFDFELDNSSLLRKRKYMDALHFYQNA
jgi:hypothetical protein